MLILRCLDKVYCLTKCQNRTLYNLSLSVVASFLTAVLAMNVFDYNWDFQVSLLFGSILSATDPVAVVSLLKDLGKAIISLITWNILLIICLFIVA